METEVNLAAAEDHVWSGMAPMGPCPPNPGCRTAPGVGRSYRLMRGRWEPRDAARSQAVESVAVQSVEHLRPLGSTMELLPHCCRARTLSGSLHPLLG